MTHLPPICTTRLVAGRRLCDRDAVRILVNEGKDRVLELIEMGMPFDRVDGKITLGLEGGHSKRRILHAGGDATGKELTSFFPKKNKRKKQHPFLSNIRQLSVC